MKKKLEAIAKQLADAEPLKYTSALRGYEVRRGGVLLGTVEFWEKRYNLRRVILVKGWRATRANGEKLYREAYTAPTRAQAAQALTRPKFKIEI